ncbi:hypothetical protein SPBR_07578 [Sporothrix brasiliensis 5110]|uniref:Uncharacterized protein n=1 Tax=Sporothrix brasiliensis 5110 TaxID=1398154 RepID=A0A0C2FDU7_9PEZI|nr:uncharacterized protein SPBR_07578 [Sporothrix brasiliensis 5110]KIH89303.1 hypothetical protein SPBR_07578 [Sporothrix brasiliensis 5110]
MPWINLILPVFFEHLSERGKINLAVDITSCQDDEQLVALASHLVNALLKPFALASDTHLRHGARLPAKTPQMPLTWQCPASSCLRDASRRGCARTASPDGYRCVYTGVWATYKYDEFERGSVTPPVDVDTQHCGQLGCAHIIPFALGSLHENDAVQTRNNAILWSCIHRYFPDAKGKIDAASIHQRSYAICLEHALHSYFGIYRVGLDRQDQDEQPDKQSDEQQDQRPDQQQDEQPDQQQDQYKSIKLVNQAIFFPFQNHFVAG